MVKVMSSVIYFCFFNAELSTVNHPLIFFSSATTSKSISKIKKEKKKFQIKSSGMPLNKKTWQPDKIFVYI